MGENNQLVFVGGKKYKQIETDGKVELVEIKPDSPPK